MQSLWAREVVEVQTIRSVFHNSALQRATRNDLTRATAVLPARVGALPAITASPAETVSAAQFYCS